MKIDKLVVGSLRENCYVLSNKDNCLVVDPGDDIDKIKKLIGNKNVLAVLVTHYHKDHVGALDDVLKIYNAKVINYKCSGIQNIGDFSFEIIHTPGHKEDAVTYYFKNDKVMFVGDFIFRDSIGRCDLDGGSMSDMIKSIEKIKKYDRNITIYPGHGYETSIGYEVDNNPYFEENLGGLYE